MIAPSELLARLADALRPVLAAPFEIEALQPAAAFVAAPALMAAQAVGLHAVSVEGRAAALLLGWFFWVRATRILYFAAARPLGLASASQYAVFTQLWLPWHLLHRLWMHAVRFFRQQQFHEGPGEGWASFAECASYPFDPAKRLIPVGRLAFMQRFPLHMTVGLPDEEKSVAYISYAGGGKSSQLATWIGYLHRDASAFIFDVDGAFTNAFAHVLEREGHKVVKLDPDNIAKGYAKAGRWNPLDDFTAAERRHGRKAVPAYAQIAAEALIIQDSQTQPVFANLARVFAKGLLLYVWTFDENKTLIRFRTLLNQGMPGACESDDEDPFARLLLEMRLLPMKYRMGEVDDQCGGQICEAIANCAALLNGQSTNAKHDSFRATAVYQTEWIDDPCIADILKESDIVGEELKLSNPVVFMVATISDTNRRLAPLVRAFTLLSLYAFERTEPDMIRAQRSLYILDEFPHLGAMPVIAKIGPAFRKYGVRLVTVSQSLGLLRKTYPDDYKEFLNQAQCVVWMGIAKTDNETLDYLSMTVLGDCLRKQKIDGFHWAVRWPLRMFGLKLPPARYQKVPRRLMTPQQCASFLDRATGQIIVTRGGKAPMRLQRLAYHQELPVTRYTPHKGHGETWPRRMTRRALGLASALLLMAAAPDNAAGQSSHPGPACAPYLNIVEWAAKQEDKDWRTGWTEGMMMDCLHEMRVNDYKLALEVWELTKMNDDAAYRASVGPRVMQSAIRAEFGQSCDTFKRPPVLENNPDRDLDFIRVAMENGDVTACIVEMGAGRYVEERKKFGQYIMTLAENGVLKNGEMKVEYIQHFAAALRHGFGGGNVPRKSRIEGIPDLDDPPLPRRELATVPAPERTASRIPDLDGWDAAPAKQGREAPAAHASTVRRGLSSIVTVLLALIVIVVLLSAAGGVGRLLRGVIKVGAYAVNAARPVMPPIDRSSAGQGEPAARAVDPSAAAAPSQPL